MNAARSPATGAYVVVVHEGFGDYTHYECDTLDEACAYAAHREDEGDTANIVRRVPTLVERNTRVILAK